MFNANDPENPDFVRSLIQVGHAEYLEEVRPNSPEVTTSELLQCGEIITCNMEAAAGAMKEMSKLVCGVVADRSEADAVCHTLKEAKDFLVITMGHIDSALNSIDDALVLFFRCSKGSDNQWHKLPVHLAEFRDHSRHVHDLWPQNRVYLNQELLPSLSSHFYSMHSVLPHAALWIAQLTRSEELFPRLRVWGQLPALIADICAAFDLIPQLLDKVETYAADMGERLQAVASRSTAIKDLKAIVPALNQLRTSWGKQFDILRRNYYVFTNLRSSRYLPFFLRSP